AADEGSAVDQHPHDAVLVLVALHVERQGIAHRRAHTVGGDDEVRLEAAPAGQLEHALRTGPDRFGAGDDLDALPPRRGDDGRVEMLPGHGLQEEAVGAVDPLEADVDAVAARLVARRLVRAVRHVVVGADRLQHALAVLPDEDAGAEGAQLGFLFVYTHAPAAAPQRDGGGEPGETGTGNFCMHRSDLTSNDRRAAPARTLRVWKAGSGSGRRDLVLQEVGHG